MIIRKEKNQENPKLINNNGATTTLTQKLISSCTGGIVTAICMTPLDVVKIRLQSQQSALLYRSQCYGVTVLIWNRSHAYGFPTIAGVPQPIYSGTVQTFLKIIQTEGIQTLWSGLTPTLCLAVPASVIYFVLYEQIKTTLENKCKERKELNNTSLARWIPLVSGATARIASDCTVSPLELIRTKMQARKLTYTEVRRVLGNLLQEHGFTGLWKGLSSTLLRDVPFSGIYWTCYETMKRKYSIDESQPHPGFFFAAGAVSGCIAAIATIPLDVAKTHRQLDIGEKNSKPSTTIVILKRIYKHNGIRGLYAGLTPRLFKVAPACAIMIGCFEYGQAFFLKRTEQRTI